MPFDKSRYPQNWPAISLCIRRRDGWRCRFCGVPNGMRGWRDDVGTFHPLHPWEVAPAGRKAITIVLTVAHWPDQDGMNCDPVNLWSSCQYDHLYLDVEQHRTNARETRTRLIIEAMQERGQLMMFVEEES